MEPTVYRAHDCDVPDCRATPQWMIVVKNERAVPKVRVTFACDRHWHERLDTVVARATATISMKDTGPFTVRRLAVRPEEHFTPDHIRELVA